MLVVLNITCHDCTGKHVQNVHHILMINFSSMHGTYQVPEELTVGAYLNEGNIYIGRTTPPAVVKLFKEQFQKDLSLFLTLRSKELVSAGHMVLTFLGRKSTEMLTHGEAGTMWELLAQALQFLVRKVEIKIKYVSTVSKLTCRLTSHIFILPSKMIS